MILSLGVPIYTERLCTVRKAAISIRSQIVIPGLNTKTFARDEDVLVWLKGAIMSLGTRLKAAETGDASEIGCYRYVPSL